MSFLSNLPTSHSGGSLSLYPTIYEIISSQEIDSLLPASLRYVLTNYWISQNPTWTTLQVNNYFEEWFNLLVMGSVEWYHLKRYNSTFVDKFYGLQRFNGRNKTLVHSQVNLINANSIKEWPRSLQLTRTQRVVLFLQKIIIPYISNRLNSLFEKFMAQITYRNNNDEKESFSFRWKKIYVKCYPIMRKMISLLNLAVKLAFLTGRGGYFSILDYLFNIEYTRMSLPLEAKKVNLFQRVDSSARMKKTNFYSLLDKFNKISSIIAGKAAYTGSKLFPTFIFMLKVYQWWTSQNLSAQLQKSIYTLDKDIPHPPLNDTEITQTEKKCPVCHNEIQNPCAIETGYVMCYPCAIEYLKTNEGKCPVTHQKLLGCIYDSEAKEWKIISGVRKLLI